MRFVEAGPEHADAYRAFMTKLGVLDRTSLGLPFSYYQPSPGITVSRRLVIDDACDPPLVVGAVNVKAQAYVLAGEVVQVAVATYPVSLGVVDAQYGSVGIYLFKQLVRAYPFNILLGMGPPETNVTAKLSELLGWTLRPIPYLFLPLRLGRAAAKQLQHKPGLARLISLADRAGMFRPLDLLQRSRVLNRCGRQGLDVAPVARFGVALDRFWEDYRDEVSFSLVRDSEQLNAMFPQAVGAFRKLQIFDGQRLVGYAVLLVPEPDDSRRAMGLNVVTLVEFSALAAHVEAAASTLVRWVIGNIDFDAVITNLSQAAAVEALLQCGFLNRTTHVYLATSRPLQRRLDEVGATVGSMVITRADGDGPIGLGVDLG